MGSVDTAYLINLAWETLSYLQTLFLLLEGSSPLHHLSPSPPLPLPDVSNVLPDVSDVSNVSPGHF